VEDSLAIPVTPGELRDDDLELKLDRFEIHSVHRVPTYRFVMIHTETHEEIGNIRLSIRSTRHVEMYAGHIGYGVLPEHRGHHYAARAVRLVAPLAFAVGIDPLWITCDPENLASRRTLELAGAELVEIVDVPEGCIIHRKGHPLKCRYRLLPRPQARTASGS
jgi:tagatose 1,6-diphosphate aldolase